MKRESVFIFMVVAALSTVGCGGSKATITGTVTYKGTAIPSGNIMFAPENGSPLVNAVIQDGKYTAERVPIGPAKVTVTSTYFEGAQPPMMDPTMRSKMGPPPEAPPEARKAFEQNTEFKKGLKIPKKYGDPGQSGLTYTVQSGKQSKDFNLE